MIGALVSLVLIAGAALIVGQSLVALAGGARRERRSVADPLAPALGLAALLVVGGVAIRLPGHAVTATIALGAVTLAAAIHLVGRLERPGGFLSAGAVVLITGLGASLPFLLAGFVGVLGVGLVNDDMASHLIIVDYVADPSGPEPSFVRGGYPTGPHAIVAAVDAVTGSGLVEAFAGLTIALPVLTGLTALGLLRDLRPLLRVVAASLVALAYLAAAYLAQGAFKEPMMALLLIGVALALGGLLGLGQVASGKWQVASRASPLLRVMPLAVLVGGIVFAYSLPGLLWVGAVGVALVLARVLLLEPRPELPDGWVRSLAPYAAGLLVALGLVLALEWDKVSDFTRLEALSPDRFGSQLGNLAQSLNPLEALGIWPASEFDATTTSASLPALAFYLGAAVALAAFVAGMVIAVRERRVALPAAALAALVVWGLLAIVGSPYVAAKGLAIAAPLVIAVSLRGTLAARGPLVALGTVLVLGAGLSSFLVLRAAAVGPSDHADQLAEIRAAVQGKDLLFLGRDDFIGWELRGSGEITGVVTNFYDVEDAKPRFKRGEGGGEKFDVDVLFPRQLDRFRYVLATRGGPASQVPPRFEVAVEGEDYVLYERTGATGRRRTLDEGTAVGAVLNCESRQGGEIVQGSGIATIWDPPPVIGEAGEWAPDDEPTDGSPSTQTLELPEAGRWLISLEYDSRRPLSVTSEEFGLDETIAANLDFRGETPTFPVAEVEVDGPTAATFSVEPEEPNLLARLLGAPNEAHLRSLTATPLDPEAIRRVPIRQACGEYVDWYRSGGPRR